jgi:hypothetical protein
MAEDRLTKLVEQTALTGIDFIKIVDPEVQTVLQVYFIIDPEDLDTPFNIVEDFDVTLLRIWAPSGGRTVFEPKIELATWEPGADERTVLQITVKEPGDHSIYRLHIDDTRVDYHFNNVEFSFKQGCPSTLDCKLVPADESCPDDTVDIPLDHTARDFVSIRGDLLDYASQKFPDWTHRSDADVGVMMIEVMAALGDELSYVQDRFVREGKLGELSQRRSLRQLVRLLDYEIHDGLSPRTLLDLRVDPDYEDDALVPAGTPFWAHRLGESPIRFEVGEGLADRTANGGEPVEFFVHKNWQNLTVHEPDEAKPKLAKGATEMFLVGKVPDDLEVPPGYLETGPEYWQETERMLVLSEDPGDGTPPKRHLVRVKIVEHTEDPLKEGDPNVTRIEWDEAYALPCPMVIANLTVSANIVPATAGEFFQELFSVRGEGTDPGVVDMVEREGPLDTNTNTRSPVYRCSPSKCETLGLGWLGELRDSTPEIEIQEIEDPDLPNVWDTTKRWEWRRTLLDSVRDDRDFTIEDGTWRRIRGFRTPDGGELVHQDWAANAGYTVRFGDGEFGQVPADGTVFRVRYRTGPGSAANVNADTIVRLVDPIAGGDPELDFLTAVSNPFAVTSGVDPEPMQRVKFLAPEAFRHDPPRAVRPDDYARIAEQLSWVQKANATFRWTGSWLTVFVAADPKGAYSLTTSQREELEDLLDGVRQVGRDVVVLEPDYVDLDLNVHLCAKPGYYAGHVEAAVLEALSGTSGFFHPDNFTFATPLRRTRLEAAIQSVEGVASVRQITIRVRDLTRWERFDKAVFKVGAEQIVRVANDPRHPERGSLGVSVREVGE